MFLNHGTKPWSQWQTSPTYYRAYVTVSSIKPTLHRRYVSSAEPDVMRLTADVKAKIQENFKKCYANDTTQTVLNTSTWLNARYKTENAAENMKRKIFEFERKLKIQ